MSGTQDTTGNVQTLAFSEPKTEAAHFQPGAEESADVQKKKMSASEKMNALIRNSVPKNAQKEIERLRKEAARYRTVSKEETAQKEALAQRAAQIQDELDSLKEVHKNLNVIRKLDLAGCIKSELVAKDIPNDCEDLDEFIEQYKSENAFLFQSRKISCGGAFKPSVTQNLTPSQQADMAIRAAFGR